MSTWHQLENVEGKTKRETQWLQGSHGKKGLEQKEIEWSIGMEGEKEEPMEMIKSQETEYKEEGPWICRIAKNGDDEHLFCFCLLPAIQLTR